jgi:hypothetical protein
MSRLIRRRRELSDSLAHMSVTLAPPPLGHPLDSRKLRIAVDAAYYAAPTANVRAASAELSKPVAHHDHLSSRRRCSVRSSVVTQNQTELLP